MEITLNTENKHLNLKCCVKPFSGNKNAGPLKPHLVKDVGKKASLWLVQSHWGGSLQMELLFEKKNKKQKNQPKPTKVFL